MSSQMKSTPSTTGSTKLNNDGVTSVPVLLKRRVTYFVQCVTAANVDLPYAISVNGKVLDAFAKRAARVSSGERKDRAGKVVRTRGEFSVMVEPGAKVALYLNSDASPQFRQHPVFGVTVAERDVEVHITEKPGKHKDAPTPTLEDAGVPKTGSSKDDPQAPKVDRYAAALTGDVWLQVSHRYTVDEVDARLPEGTREEVKAAIRKIYGVLSEGALQMAVPLKADKPASSLTIKFTDSENPKQNISNYNLLSDGLPRVHPGGFAALITAALEAELPSIVVSSCWRPMLGSIAHRAGLGLDVAVLGTTTLNRQELRTAIERSGANPQGNGNDRDNVTDAEVKAFGQYEQAVVDTKHAKTERDEAVKALAAAKKSGGREAIDSAEERLDAAQQTLRNTSTKEQQKLDAWNAERDKGEPSHVHQYRASLLRCACVRQLFDPWFMNIDTHRAGPLEPNMQKSGNETLHAHHLHITVDDPKIL